MKEKESDIQKAIIDYLRLKKYVVFKHHSTGFTVRDGKTAAFRYGDKGIADVIACSPNGRFIAIEVKKKTGKASPEQLEFLERVRANGGIAILARNGSDYITFHTGGNTEKIRMHANGGLKFVGQSAAPTAEAGTVYYDTDDNKLKVYNGTTWVDLN